MLNVVMLSVVALSLLAGVSDSEELHFGRMEAPEKKKRKFETKNKKKIKKN